MLTMFKVVSHAPSDDNSTLVLEPVQDASENSSVFRHAPGGDVRLLCVVSELAQDFPVGKLVLVELTPIG